MQHQVENCTFGEMIVGLVKLQAYEQSSSSSEASTRADSDGPLFARYLSTVVK